MIERIECKDIMAIVAFSYELVLLRVQGLKLTGA